MDFLIDLPEILPSTLNCSKDPFLVFKSLNTDKFAGGSLAIANNISSYLKKGRKVFDDEKFDLVINDGDMGSNVLANNRNITSLFVTNQFKPKLWKSRMYFKPALEFVAKQISKASRILVADSEPPYTMCEYNLNFSKEIQDKVTYVGHFTSNKTIEKNEKSDLEKLISDSVYGYWMRTGNKSTNDGTGERYEEAFHQSEMKDEKRIISHARDDPSIDRVLDKNGNKYTFRSKRYSRRDSCYKT